LQLVDERRATEIQQPRGLALVAAGLFETPQNEVAFELRDHTAEVQPLVGNRDAWVEVFHAWTANLFRKRFEADVFVRAAHHHCVLDRVLELAHVSWPVIGHQQAERFLCQRLFLHAVLPA
jgi:hypothetical protein